MSRDAALALGAKGFRVFRTHGKKAWETFFDIATSNASLIREWWKETSKWSVGISTDDLLALDVDTVDKKTGLPLPWREELQELVNRGLPTDAIAQTQSGAYHVFLRLPPGVKLGNTQHGRNSPWKSIDTKSEHGYVIGPGSKGYKWLNEPATVSEIPMAPDWLIAMLPRYQAKRDRPQLLPDERLDTVSAKKYVIDYLINRAAIAKDGDGGQLTTIAVANDCMDYVSEAATFDLMAEHWNEIKADGPWDMEWLERLVRHAAKYRKNAIGYKSAEAQFEATEPMPPEPVEWPCATPFILPDQKDIPPREWLIQGIAARRFVTGLVAPSGSGKTQWFSQLLLAAATGRGEIANADVKEKLRVWSWNQEDDRDELTRRIAAGADAYGVTREDLDDRVLLDSGVERALKLAALDEHGNACVVKKNVDQLIAEIRKKQIDILIVDPLIEFHKGKEMNDDLKVVAGELRRIAQVADCAVLLGHHTKKPEGASSDGFAGNQDASRGGTSLVGVARIILTLFTMSEKDAKAWSVPSEARSQYVRLDGAKSNISLAHRGARPEWFRWASRELANGDSIGVLEVARLHKAESRVQRINAITDAVVDRTKAHPAGPLRWTLIRDELIDADLFTKEQLKRWMTEQESGEHLFDGGNFKLIKNAGATGCVVEWVAA